VEVGRLAAVLKGLRGELLRVPIRARRKLLEGLVTKTWMDRFQSDARGAHGRVSGDGASENETCGEKTCKKFKRSYLILGFSGI
jgi:hypothetical protein